MGDIIGPALEKSGLPLMTCSFSDCGTDSCLCRCGGSSYDDGSWNHGGYAGSCRIISSLSGGYGLCD